MKRSHVEKRLDSRAAPAVAERGLALLRDRAALAALIETLTTTRSDLQGAQRLAFALGQGDVVAHAIVARDGSGVTCLAAGMSVAAPLVPWPLVEAFLRQQESQLQARRTLHSVKESDDDVSPLVRMVEHPHRLVRREWDLLRALLPILGVPLFSKSVLMAIDHVINAVARQKHPPNAAVAKEMWRLYVGGAVGITLVGDQRGVTLMHISALLSGDLILAARAVWYLANQPEETLAFAKSVADHSEGPVNDNDRLLRFGLAFALPALGFRCPSYFKEAERLRVRLIGGEPADESSGRRDVERLTVANAPLLLRAFCPDAQSLLQDLGTTDRVAQANDVEAMTHAASSWHRDVFGIWRPFENAQQPPRLAPRPVRSATDDDDASATLWRSLLRQVAQPLLLHPWMAKLVTLAPIEALIPGDEPDPQWRLSEGVAYVQEQLEWVLKPAALRTTTTKSAPVRVDKKPEPNGPCPCGSGKKWKKCHGKG